ncbi:M61 family metallopeptidase [Noviherbaspirillum aridicola]|uniref:Peptidase n=1 Tax=Noviherbaspirillum aridicola TaxID=2849687 RepID=A0ABQ4Q8H7_9BURK|nr:M61 family metallopeptidase [Noviherbaspirillum aridicola]GIZ53508.1 peptidase [Noviherbaspirillum aridicola]
MKNAVNYTVVARDPAAHLFEVTLVVDAPDPQGQVFSLPAWIPGSYMIREFARNIVRIAAESNGEPVPLKKLDKHTWQAAPCRRRITVRYEVYAWDLSVRAAHLDQTHGFFNGTSMFLSVLGKENLPHVVDIRRPEGEIYRNWRVATAMPELKARRYGFGSYIAADYDELIDHPVEMGDFALATFKAHGVPHDIVITGRVPGLDIDRIAADLKKVCEAQIALFEPGSRRAPMQRYVFMTMAVGDGYGGLEHRASTALICSRNDLPVLGQREASEAYRTYLGLCSHEYFHTWNVKRIKPAVFAPYDLRTEGYTSLLWLFEGFTSYYDDLMLVRSGLIDEKQYLSAIAKTVNSVLRGSGRHKQSVAESSYDAWIKYYRQDENAPNAIVSYYAKGSLVGLALDLTLRAETGGRKSLDDIMRALWQRFGRDFAQAGQGLGEDEARAIFEEVGGVKLRRFFERYVEGTEDLPLDKLLAPFGVTQSDNRKDARPALGIRSSGGNGECKITHVYEGFAAHRAGLSAGDVLIAMDGLRVTASNLDKLLSRYRVGDTVLLHAFRRDELIAFSTELMADDTPRVAFEVQEKPAALARMRRAWLGTEGR